jgi:hypothetical protein
LPWMSASKAIMIGLFYRHALTFVAAIPLIQVNYAVRRVASSCLAMHRPAAPFGLNHAPDLLHQRRRRGEPRHNCAGSR